MIDDSLRARVARECREHAYRERFEGERIARIIGAPYSGTTRYDHDAWYRLADMIEPNPDMCAGCPERKTGADEERYPKQIRVGDLDRPRFCSNCGAKVASE